MTPAHVHATGPTRRHRLASSISWATQAQNLVLAGLVSLSLTSCATPPAPVTTAGGARSGGVAASLWPTRPSADGAVASVRRGDLVVTSVLNGRVDGISHVDVKLPQPSTVRQVLVDLNATVRAGDSLFEVERGASAAGSQEASAIAAGLIQEQYQHLDQVIAQLDRMRSLPTGMDRLVAQSVLMQAQANLQRLEAERDKLSSAPNSAERRLAEQDADAAQAALRRAETEQDRILRGADEATIRRAETDVTAAEADLAKAQATYRQLVRGPDAADIKAAERDVAQAEETLDMARGMKPVPLPTPTARPSGNGNREVRAERDARTRVAQDAANQQIQQEIATRQAETAYQNAKDRLARLQRGPGRAEVEAAASDVQASTRRLEDAKQRVSTLRQGPDRAAQEAAASAVATARSGLARAEKRLDTLTAGPADDAMAAATSAVNGARQAVQAAEARLADVSAGAAERQRVELDVAARDTAIRGALDQSLNPALWNAVLSARQARPQSAASGAAIVPAASESARVAAPSDGVVSAIYVTAGDQVEQGRTVASLVTSDARVVLAALSDGESDRIGRGMPASIKVDGEQAPLKGKVTALQSVNGSTLAVMSVDWREASPKLGGAAQATVLLARRANTLSVPASSVRDDQGTRYVEVVDGNETRRVDVVTGLETGSEIEIVAGLIDGQVVRLAQ